MQLAGRAISMVALAVILILHAGCAGNTSGGNPAGGGVSVPAVPAGLAATPGNAQISLNWNASFGSASYNVKRSTTTGGPYSQISSPSATSFTDTGLTNGTKYF
jgi:hypothetical protein